MNLIEKEIEDFAIEIFRTLGYQYISGSKLTPDAFAPERESLSSVVLEKQLLNSLENINPTIPQSKCMEVVQKIKRLYSGDLERNNEEFYNLLINGVSIEYKREGKRKMDLVWIIDFDNYANNNFSVVNQFTVTGNNLTKRPDIVVFVNGIPLVVMELKRPVNEKISLSDAYNQIQTYKKTVPSLFAFNALNIISDGLVAKAGSLTAGPSRYMSWKSPDGVELATKLQPELEVLMRGMLNKETLLDLVRFFTVFDKETQTDSNGITSLKIIKKIAAYHQYYAVNKAINSIRRASSRSGNHKGGVIWHTQGSGKSLSMAFLAGKAVFEFENPTIVIITDRNDLDNQLFDTFSSSINLLRQAPVQAESRNDLKKILKVASGGIVFTTIQKFQPVDKGNVFEELSNRKNVIVIADEAHRTQYGFKPKTIDEKDEKGIVIGQRIVYGFAKYMRDALPNATYIGFTGTPVEGTDNNTPAVFGEYIDIYDIAQAVEDGATVPIYYESRLAKVFLSEKGKELIEELDEQLEKDEIDDNEKAKLKWTKLEAIVGSEQRLRVIASDIVTHYEEREKAQKGKAMIVAMSRRVAVELFDKIIEIRPSWHNDDFLKGKIKVVMTSSSSDELVLQKHHTTKEQRRKLGERMKDVDDELKLVIVIDMWLTGFDSPSMHTLYIDKPMKGHNLMQAIARVNRVYKDKSGGLVVDYIGVAHELKKALLFYSDSGGKGHPFMVQEKAINMMLEKLEVVSQLFDGFQYENYFGATTRDKLAIILAAENHILGLENGKQRFLKQVQALSKSFSIALPNEQAMDVKEEVAFFQAIKVRLAKFGSKNSSEDKEVLDTAIKQIIDSALVAEGVVDIFDAAGIKKPDISVLSDEFLSDIKNMEHQNIAVEVLKKLLNNEISIRGKKNLLKGKKLSEMLDKSIKRYQNRVIGSVEVIEELIKLAKEISQDDIRKKELGLSDDEIAFYDAVAVNESARLELGDEKLKQIAIVLVEKVRKNVTIDWSLKESVQAKLRVIVKRTLRKYGYPPDMQKMATDIVLKQAELLADYWNEL